MAGTSARKGVDSPELRLIGGACISHLGCRISAPRLPACTAPGAIPAGYVRVRGKLSLSPHAFYSGHESVLQCSASQRTALVVRDGSNDYDLGLWCYGDRTGWCCPYPLGTEIDVIGKAEDDHGTQRLVDYWMCGNPAPQPVSTPRTTGQPVVLRLGQPPGYATWSFGSTLATWDFRDARLLEIHSDAQKPFVCADFDPTGRRVFTLDRAGEAIVWELGTGKRSATLANFAPGARVQPFVPDVSCTYELADAVAWAPDGRALLAINAKGAASVYSADSGAFHRLPDPCALDNFHYEFFGPDGHDLLFAATNDRLELWQVAPLQQRQVFQATRGAWSPDGKQVLVRLDPGAAKATTYQLRDVADGRLRWELPNACLAEWSPNARYVAAQVPCGNGETAVFDAASGRRVARLRANYRPLWSGRQSPAPQYSPDLSLILQRGFLGHSVPIPELQVDPAHSVLAAASFDGVVFWRGAGHRVSVKGEIGRTLSSIQFDPALEWSPDGTTLGGRRRLWSLRGAGKPRSVDLPARFGGGQLIWSPDSRYLALWSWSQRGREGDFETRTRLGVVARDSGRVVVSEDGVGDAGPQQSVVGLLSPSWLPDRPILVAPVPGSDQLVELIDVARGRQLWFAVAADESGASGLALAKDGRFEGRRELISALQFDRHHLSLPRELREERGLLEDFLKP